MNKNAFRKGWGRTRGDDQPKVKEEIMRVLNISTNNGFCDRRKGKVTHNDAERESIEQIFNKYNVKPEEVWGN